MKNAPAPSEVRLELQRVNAEKRQQEFAGKFRSLTPKQQAVADTLLQDPKRLDQLTQVCREAGYVCNDRTRAARILRAIDGKLGDIFFEAFGVTEYDLAKVLTDGLYAERTAIITDKDYLNGQLVRERQRMVSLGADHRTRMSAAKLITSMGKYKSPTKFEGKMDHYAHPAKEQLGEEVLARLNLREKRAIPMIGSAEIEEGQDVN